MDNTIAPGEAIDAIRKFWDEYVYDDIRIAKSPSGTQEFFDELEMYRLQRLSYLPRIVDFAAYEGKKVLEIGCRIGIDLVNFAKLGAVVTGIELAESCIETAKKNFAVRGLSADLRVMNGEDMEFEDESFDMVFAFGVIQYTEEPERMIRETYRVLKRGGEAIIMVYNRRSWLNILSKLSSNDLEHENAPAFEKYSLGEFEQALSSFSQLEMIPERFPAKTGLHSGLMASLYYSVFVGAFNMIPRRIVRPFGSHLIAKAIK